MASRKVILSSVPSPLTSWVVGMMSPRLLFVYQENKQRGTFLERKLTILGKIQMTFHAYRKIVQTVTAIPIKWTGFWSRWITYQHKRSWTGTFTQTRDNKPRRKTINQGSLVSCLAVALHSMKSHLSWNSGAQ